MFYMKYNHFKYRIMLFGLSNTRASFHSYINKIFAKKLDIFIIVYKIIFWSILRPRAVLYKYSILDPKTAPKTLYLYIFEVVLLLLT